MADSEGSHHATIDRESGDAPLPPRAGTSMFTTWSVSQLAALPNAALCGDEAAEVNSSGASTNLPESPPPVGAAKGVGALQRGVRVATRIILGMSRSSDAGCRSLMAQAGSQGTAVGANFPTFLVLRRSISKYSRSFVRIQS